MSCIYWTEEVQDSMSKDKLAEYRSKCDKQIDEIVRLVRGPLTSGERITLGALIVVDVHGQFLFIQWFPNDGTIQLTTISRVRVSK